MSWLSTLLTAVITAALGTVLSGYTAVLAIRWYRISGFEGKSGYFMVAMALIGLMVGLVIGVVVSRIVAASANPSLLKALGISLGTMAGLVAIVGGVARVQADVPPRIDDELLMLMVEARWPATHTESPANTPGVSYLELGAVSSRVQRASRRGALWKEDAKLVDGRWVVPGAVFIFSGRGDRVIDVALNDSSRTGLMIRLGSSPGKKDMEWSEWYPKDGRNGPTKEDGITYRYRVQKASQPIRTETIGQFTVSAIAVSFQAEVADGTNTLDPVARFDVKYQGKPVRLAGGDSAYVGMVASLPSARPSLLAYIESENSPSYCALLIDDGNAVREERVDTCSNHLQAQDITTDSARFTSMKTARPPRGRVDQRTYASSSLLLLNTTVLNAKTLAVHQLNDSNETFVVSVPPLGVSPDERSVVRFFYGEAGSSAPMLKVTNFAQNRSYDFPIDPVRMRFTELDELTPAWLLHHFEWKRGADGVDMLQVRPNFVPIPYFGYIRDEPAGKPSYRINSGGQSVRMALVEHIEKEYGGKRAPAEESAYEYPMTVEGKKLTVATTGDNDYVLVSLEHGETDSDIAARIGRSFNAVLATGRLDALFVK